MSDGVKAAIVGSICTALAAAVITSGRVDQLIDWATGRATATPTPSAPASSSAGATKTVTDRQGSLHVTVPGDWGVGTSNWNVSFGGMTDPGAGIRTGSGAGVETRTYDVTTFWLGASRSAATRLLLRLHPEELPDWLRDVVGEDYSIDGCVFVRDAPLEKRGHVGWFREWKGCAGLPDARLYVLAAAALDGSVLVMGQLQPGPLSEAEAEAVLTSFEIRTELLPVGAAQPVSGSSGFPAPAWVPVPSSAPSKS